ncbi:MAG TPA: hypothetical protein PLQ64_05030 [Thiobacillaceae bacterium]|nr:hypothetical protein [Thiobacillaceae bacterium]HNA81813.1 hypothetical protein [Thiobacillaceae bacterium]
MAVRARTDGHPSGSAGGFRAHLVSPLSAKMDRTSTTPRRHAMSDDGLSPNLLTLKEALPSTLYTLGQSLNAREPALLPCPDMLPEVRWHIRWMLAGIGRLTDIINKILAPVALADGRAADAAFAMNRLNDWILDWAERMNEARRLHPGPEERDVRDWLVATYRHVLRDLESGLADLASMLEDPKAERVRRGLPRHGKVMLPLEITLTECPEVTRLADWAEARGRRPPPTQHPAHRQGLGFWGWVGAIALGSWIGSCLGDDD